MNDFLLEILVEEIPAPFQADAVRTFEELMIANLQNYRIPFENVKSFISPRRMVFSAKLDAEIPAFIEEKKGPQVNAPENVIENFLNSCGIGRNECVEKTVGKKTFIFVNIQHAAQKTADVLADIVKNVLSNIQWKKSMHWGEHVFHFARPIRNIMAIFAGTAVDIDFQEIGLKSRDRTVGHRFLSPAEVTACNIDEYLAKMREAFVIVDAERRKHIILDEFKKIEAERNITIEFSDALLNEVVGLVEYPVVLVGNIPEKFMQLPEEVIVTPMKTYQRYFPTRMKDGRLAPYFITVANNVTVDGGATIMRGNERVLNARLADAYFFFQTDLQKPLESHLDDLKKITFQERLGTLYERTKRLIAVCDFVHEEVSQNNAELSAITAALLRRAATLAKCDLPTTMVCEFTELQGIMGGHYARIQQENHAVCDAIRDQYKMADDITATISALLSLSDKIEIITAFFVIGKAPTGSKDPFALRRAAIGILKTIIKHNFTINLRTVISKAFAQLHIEDKNEQAIVEVIDFINDRFKVLLKDFGVDPAIALSVVDSNHDVLSCYHRAVVLQEILQSDAGALLLSVYKRSKNIIGEIEGCQRCNADLLKEHEESALYAAIQAVKCKLEKTELIADQKEQLKQQLLCLIEIEPIISLFFEKVLVNDSDENIKNNRIALIGELVSLFDVINVSNVLNSL